MKVAAWVSGCLIAACVAVLLWDYAIASRRAVKDELLVKAMQEQVKNDASLAGKLACEQKRITSARRARKARDRFVAWLLIGTSGVFLFAAKRVVIKSSSAGRNTNSGNSRSGNSSTNKTRMAAAPAASGNGGCSDAPVVDLGFVEELVAREGGGKEAAIVLLQAIQSHYRYLPDEALRRLCELTEITPAEVAGTSTFYGQFRGSPVGKHVVRVCHGTACHVAGARQITEELRRHLDIAPGADTDTARLFTVDEVACLGCCSLAPVLTVDGQTSGRLTPATACNALEPLREKESA